MRQEWHDPKAGTARKRAKQLRDAGFQVTVSDMGPQVTRVGLIRLSMLTVYTSDLIPAPVAGAEPVSL